MKSQKQVYAILRYDEFQNATVSIEDRITVTRIVHDEGTADAEVRRLNDLNREKGCRYFWQTTRLGEPTS
jgi:hypothetical protein